MIINQSVGVAKRGVRHDGNPITAVLPGSTAWWPKESFEDYLWYRLIISIPNNFGRPKIMGWQIIPVQEDKPVDEGTYRGYDYR